MTRPAFIAGDWGATNLRVWVVGEGGDVLARRDFPFGVSRLKPGEAAARFEGEVRPALGAESLPALLCGMIGSTLGWTTAAYLICPASLAALPGSLTIAAPGVRIVPGLRCRGLAGPDVLRGEETQVLGWMAGGPPRTAGRHLLCLPGTHAKWVRLADGRIDRFVTAMTGELHGLLTSHGILRSHGSRADSAAFDEGVEAAGDGGALSARLFSARSRVLAGDLPAASTASYLSGLLIGAEIAALWPLMRDTATDAVGLIGDAALCGWYRRVLIAKGAAVTVTDGEAASLAGLEAIWREAP